MQPEPLLISELPTVSDQQLDALLDAANDCLGVSPVSVIDKAILPPSGDSKDWMNLADYSWPNPESPNGLPYITRDGEANPEALQYDRRRFNLLVTTTLRLGAAWQATGNKKYSEKAAKLLVHWFVNPSTAMNPNLNFAHHVPGDVPGRSDGLIVFCSALPSLLDVWLLLSLAGSFTKDQQETMSTWVERFLKWLCKATISLEHREAKNNHGTYHDLLIAYLLLFLGRTKDAAQLLVDALPKRLKAQVSPSGEQPMESGRTLSAQYSMYNLKALLSLAQLSRAAGVDTWTQPETSGQLVTAVRFLYRHAIGEKVWPFQQIEPANWWFLVPLCQFVNRSYSTSFDTGLIPARASSPAGVPIEPIAFVRGWELIFVPSHRQHLPIGMEADTDRAL